MQSSPRIEELRKKFHENPRRYFAPLANEYRKAGDPEQAIAICRAHLAQQPAHMSGHVVYGQALYDAHRIDEAREVFQLALALDPENLIVLRHLGDIARQRGDVQEARSWYSRALDGDPHDAEVAAYLAELTEPLVSHGVEPEIPAPVATEVETTKPIELEGEAATPVAQDDEATATIPPDTEPAFEAPLEAAPDIDESPYLETEEPRAPTPAEPASEPAPLPADRQPRLTPTSEGFPILTRTLAELYLQQGHIVAALDIYRQLAEHEPGDADIRARIAALTFDEQAGVVPAREKAAALMAEPQSDEGRALETKGEPDEDREAESESEHPLTGAAADEQVVEEELKEAADFTGGDDLEIADLTGGDYELATDMEESRAGADSDVSAELETSEAGQSDRLWDTADFWGGGFFEDTEAEDEIFGLPDDAFSVASRNAADVPPEEPEPLEATAEEEPDDAFTEAQSAEMAAEGGPSELASQIEPEREMESAGAPVEFVSANLAGAAYFENPEPDRDESPYASDSSESFDEEMPASAEAEAELPEVATRVLTVREFFATLGSIKPPFAMGMEGAHRVADAEPVRDVSSTVEAPVAEEAYRFADDAFSSLFADAPINAEDSRAATALSSAVAHGAPFSTPSTPSGSHRRAPVPPREEAGQPGQESEEDIRRFREWLDGLAES